VLLHIINRLSDIEGRGDIIPENNFLQLATLKLEKGKTFRPHKHIWKQSTEPEVIAQESWVVIEGKVKFYFYDLDDTLIGTEILEPGDSSITLQGAHTYEILEDSIIYEYKTGPYQGVKLDKEFLDA
jgi:hypothetical protein